MNPAKKLYATWYDRLIAYIIDMSILSVLPYSIFIGITATFHPENPEKIDIAPETLAAFFLMKMAYYIFFLSRPRQATPGMRLMAIRTVRTDGRPLSQRDALERHLAFILPDLPLYASFLPEGVRSILFFALNMSWFIPVITTQIGMHDRLLNMRVINGKMR